MKNVVMIIKFTIRIVLFMHIMLLSPIIILMYWSINNVSLKEAIDDFKIEVKDKFNYFFKTRD